MVDNVAGDDVEPKPAKNEASDDASGVGSGNVKPLKSKYHFKLTLVKLKNLQQYLSVVFAKFATPPHFLTTNARWREREELLGWVRRQGERVGFNVCIDNSILKRPYLTMQCERSGIYKPPKTRKKPNLEDIDSRKCNCLFRFKGLFDKDINDWWISMLCVMHNHDLEESYKDTFLRVDLVRRRIKKLST